MLTLLEPTLDLEAEFMAMVAEYLQAGEVLWTHTMARQDFASFVQKMQDFSLGANLEPGYVPMTTYWLVADGHTILGESRLRHTLSPDLEKEGGHIGYAIRPTARRKGYGTLILTLTLAKAKERGLKRVLVTCNTANTGSARIIEKNGGILASQGISEESGQPVSRYWIDEF
jgi:predicted acetyltransferase